MLVVTRLIRIRWLAMLSLALVPYADGYGDGGNNCCCCCCKPQFPDPPPIILQPPLPKCCPCSCPCSTGCSQGPARDSPGISPPPTQSRFRTTTLCQSVVSSCCPRCCCCQRCCCCKPCCCCCQPCCCCCQPCCCCCQPCCCCCCQPCCCCCCQPCCCCCQPCCCCCRPTCCCCRPCCCCCCRPCCCCCDCDGGFRSRRRRQAGPTPVAASYRSSAPTLGRDFYVLPLSPASRPHYFHSRKDEDKAQRGPKGHHFYHHHHHHHYFHDRPGCDCKNLLLNDCPCNCVPCQPCPACPQQPTPQQQPCAMNLQPCGTVPPQPAPCNCQNLGASNMGAPQNPCPNVMGAQPSMGSSQAPQNPFMNFNGFGSSLGAEAAGQQQQQEQQQQQQQQSSNSDSEPSPEDCAYVENAMRWLNTQQGQQQQQGGGFGCYQGCGSGCGNGGFGSSFGGYGGNEWQQPDCNNNCNCGQPANSFAPNPSGFGGTATGGFEQPSPFVPGSGFSNPFASFTKIFSRRKRDASDAFSNSLFDYIVSQFADVPHGFEKVFRGHSDNKNQDGRKNVVKRCCECGCCCCGCMGCMPESPTTDNSESQKQKEEMEKLIRQTGPVFNIKPTNPFIPPANLNNNNQMAYQPNAFNPRHYDNAMNGVNNVLQGVNGDINGRGVNLDGNALGSLLAESRFGAFGHGAQRLQSFAQPNAQNVPLPLPHRASFPSQPGPLQPVALPLSPHRPQPPEPVHVDLPPKILQPPLEAAMPSRLPFAI